jgi:hypothetical protein
MPAGDGSSPRAAAQGTEGPLVLTRLEDREAAVGKLVTIEGEVSNTKIPQILGIDVSAESLREKRARATGILKKRTVTQEELDREIAKHGMFANRGPGTFYRLVKEGSEGLADAVAVP